MQIGLLIDPLVLSSVLPLLATMVNQVVQWLLELECVDIKQTLLLAYPLGMMIIRKGLKSLSKTLHLLAGAVNSVALWVREIEDHFALWPVGMRGRKCCHELGSPETIFLRQPDGQTVNVSGKVYTRGP
ncbi:hypothetical protein TWF696_006777 [Orbilia brochopaga]|uniref:Uncharacterized protein n=1 Tax=Orbilia brochopaga TaxID=3140254 RepID=A0AAV9UPW2_9PEZI